MMGARCSGVTVLGGRANQSEEGEGEVMLRLGTCFREFDGGPTSASP
jgi:hypothetical protein